jgi:hypothetical protein
MDTCETQVKLNAEALKTFFTFKYLDGVYIVVLAGKHALQLRNFA